MWKNLALAALSIAVVVLAGLTWQRGRRIAELEDAAAHATEKQRDLWQRLSTAERRLADVAKAQTTSAADTNEPSGRSGRVRGRLPDSARDAAGFAPFENPAMQRMMTTGMRASLDQRYGPLFRQLKLSPGELERLKDLLTERQMSTIDAMTTARTQGIAPNEIPALINKVQGDVDGSIRQLLGDDRFGRYQEFNQNIGSYALLDQIERRLSYTNSPLQAAQSEALLRTLVETAPRPAAESGPMGGMNVVVQSFGGAGPMSAALTQSQISESTLSRAATILDATQLEVLRQLQTEQQAQTNAFQSVLANPPAGGPARGTIMTVPAPPPDRAQPPKR